LIVKRLIGHIPHCLAGGQRCFRADNTYASQMLAVIVNRHSPTNIKTQNLYYH